MFWKTAIVVMLVLVAFAAGCDAPWALGPGGEKQYDRTALARYDAMAKKDFEKRQGAAQLAIDSINADIEAHNAYIASANAEIEAKEKMRDATWDMIVGGVEVAATSFGVPPGAVGLLMLGLGIGGTLLTGKVRKRLAAAKPATA